MSSSSLLVRCSREDDSIQPFRAMYFIVTNEERKYWFYLINGSPYLILRAQSIILFQVVVIVSLPKESLL